MSKNTIITILIIIAFILAFYFLTKGPNNSENQVSDQTKIIMPTLAPSKVTELKIEDIKIGSGREVKSGDTVVINYIGTLEDGTKFDSSYDRNQPIETQIGTSQVIQGWEKGIPGMKIGGKRKLTIPYQLAYGEKGYGSIPPKATLIFEVELVAIK
jgi:FKBP-type peptidyl-prolyl cis-trans isomerase